MTISYNLNKEELNILSERFTSNGISRPIEVLEKYFEEQEQNKRTVILIYEDNASQDIEPNNCAGYVTIKWQPEYEYFAKNNIPEISDLVVLPNYRGKKYGFKLLEAAEIIIKEKRQFAGIGVGLYADYGKAFKLYISLGYAPDGNGVTYNNLTVPPGNNICLDNDLVLWFIKKL